MQKHIYTAAYQIIEISKKDRGTKIDYLAFYISRSYILLVYNGLPLNQVIKRFFNMNIFMNYSFFRIEL